MSFLRAGFFAPVLLFVTVPASATTIHVPGDSSTIKAAVAGAISGDTILVAAGDYVGEGNRDVTVVDSSLVIRSEDGYESTTIRCGGSVAEPHRAFNLVGHFQGSTVIEGFTITGGYAPPEEDNEISYTGGAIFISGAATPMIRDCRFVENYARTSGGAVSVFNCGPEIVNCIFKENTAGDLYGRGGAVLLVRSGANVMDCVFSRNEGGAIHIGGTGVPPTIDGCTFFLNVRRSTISVEGSRQPIIRHCTLFADSLGGESAIRVENTASVIVENTIIACTHGPAIACSADSEITISCSDLYHNFGGDWTGCAEGQLGVRGNFSGDPRFCNPARDLRLGDDSPCLNALGCGLVGALPRGCGTGSESCPYPSATEASTWGSVKTRYR